MSTLDSDEAELLNTYERGELLSVATEEELARLRAAAEVTATANRRAPSPGVRRTK